MTKRDMVFKNRNEKRIQATLRQPAGSADAIKGTIVLLHGLGGWKEQPLLVIIADTLCQNGYNVFTFDAADGAKGPDGDFAHGTTTGFVEDLDDVVGHVTNSDWYTAPLLIAGHSLGGLAALHYTRLHPAQVSKLMLFAPAVSWKRGLALTFVSGLFWLARNKRKTPGPNHSKLPLDRAWLLDFMKFDALRDAPYVSAPTLIVSANKDTAVTSPQAHYALANRFANATSIVIPGAGHVFWKHEQKLADTITKWLTSS
jgi:alpha-beta hydrolase superfamily lysophospholipase